MNIIVFTGNLGHDISLKEKNGKEFGLFSVANTVGYGEHKHTQWFSCMMPGERSKKLKDFLKKGKKVQVVGELSIKDGETRNGEKVKNINVFVKEIELLNAKDEKNPEEKPNNYKEYHHNNAPSPQVSPSTPSHGFDDEIPF